MYVYMHDWMYSTIVHVCVCLSGVYDVCCGRVGVRCFGWVYDVLFEKSYIITSVLYGSVFAMTIFPISFGTWLACSCNFHY